MRWCFTIPYTNSAPQYRTYPWQDIFAIVAPQTHKIGFQLSESREFLCQHAQHLRTQDLDGYTGRWRYALLYEVESSIRYSGVNGRRLEIGSCKASSKVHLYLYKYRKETNGTPPDSSILNRYTNSYTLEGMFERKFTPSSADWCLSSSNGFGPGIAKLMSLVNRSFFLKKFPLYSLGHLAYVERHVSTPSY